MKRLFCLWLPNWPIQRVRAERPIDAALEPDRADRPVVLWAEDPRRGRLVAACCNLARAAGVKVSMPIAQASEMVQRASQTPQLIPHDVDADDQALLRLVWRVQQQITPAVEAESIDEKPWAGCPRHQRESLIGDIGGVDHLFGGERGLLHATANLLKRSKLSGRVAVADSTGAAWAIAHFGRMEDAVDPGRWIAPPCDSEAMLRRLPVESLRIDSSTAETLARLGVEQVGQLLQLPRSGLVSRLGRGLVHRMEQALGERQEPLAVEAAPEDDREVCELEYPTSDLPILNDRIGRLVKKVRAGLAARQRGALRMSCHLDLSIPPPLTLEIGLFAPTVDDEHLCGLITNRLESTRLRSDVVRLTVAVTLSGPLRTAQTSLFETDDSTANLSGSAISRLVDSLSGRLGRDSVLQVKLQDDPLPENAYRVVPLAGNQVSFAHLKPRSKRKKRTGPTTVNTGLMTVAPGDASVGVDNWIEYSAATTPYASGGDLERENPAHRTIDLPSADDAMRRPLRLFDDPIPLSVAFDDDRFWKTVSCFQLPRRIRFSGAIHSVVRHWGPERIETGWWKGPSVRRDYYRIETDRGRWWWIFRNLADSQTRGQSRWMLHGFFD